MAPAHGHHIWRRKPRRKQQCQPSAALAINIWQCQRRLPASAAIAISVKALWRGVSGAYNKQLAEAAVLGTAISIQHFVANEIKKRASISKISANIASKISTTIAATASTGTGGWAADSVAAANGNSRHHQHGISSSNSSSVISSAIEA